MINLVELLKKSKRNEIAEDCFKVINSDEIVDCKSGESLPCGYVLKIYTFRSRLNKLKGSKIQGYDSLLESLRKSPFERIKIHLIKTAANNYIVFTDSEETYLLGVLKIKKRSPQDASTDSE